MEIIKKTIGEIESLIKTGKTPPSKEERYYNGNINWYTPGDLDKEKFLGKSNRTITEEALAENKATILPKNTVVIGAIGDIGKLGITTIESCTNQQITGIRTNEEVYFEYFYYWLKANKHLLRSKAKNAILPILNNENIRSIKIEFPKDIEDQKRIAKVLSQCESLIQKRKQSIDLLDELLKSTFSSMFGRYDEIKQTDIDTLGNNISYLTSGSRGWAKYYTENGAKFLRIQNVGNGIIRTDNLIYVNPPKSAESERTRVQPGDLVISITADLGRTSVIPENIGEAYINQHLALIRLNKNINPVYAAYFYNMPFGNNAIQRKNRSAVKAGLNFNDIRSFPIVIPELPLQNKFVQIVDKIEVIKQAFKLSLKELENLYESISQRAFKGELDLSKLNISDMEDSKKNDLEEVKDDITGGNEGTLKNKAEIIEIIENKKENDSYINENGLLYIEKSKSLRSKIYSLIKGGDINEVDFSDDLMEINKIGEQFHSEIQEFTPWQIDQHKSVERYIALLPKLILDEYPYIKLFSSNQFDYNSMSLDEYYGIPEDIIMQYGSIEDKTTDLVFFFKKYFSNKLFTIEDLEKKYNQVVYDRGDWFKYEEMKEFIFKAIDGDDALLTQTFEEVEILDIELGKPQTIKKIMLKVI
ncbi:restriction endonuclease subunit S [Flavobacterium aquicola]|uniref:Restriction endonuclease S subunit n=1 Tax=Flavobacterium aquicola TaxID=1682742 RepID=A0A3E0ES32_9FLAO|nr:restriction endonuclease subunit S [Flavobacterium aquicola]REH00992.1 restriction endonuclease S subunit [Flavobacterium aquicola]